MIGLSPPGAASAFSARLVVGFVLAVGCAPPAAPATPQSTPRPAPPALRWRACRLPGLAEPASCARVPVFENRRRHAGRQLEIHVARLAAVSGSPAADPLIFLAGGPGQAASDVAAHVLPGLMRVRRRRDLLFVDLRGTGRSAALRCPPDAADQLAVLFSPSSPAQWLTACRARYRVDLRQYTTANAADDLEEVRQALHLGRVNVLGVSYGTRVALTWMRRHPDALRAAILDGVAPPQMPLFAPFARDSQRAWRLLVRDCGANAACHARFPRLAGSLSRLLASLPTEAHIRHPITHTTTTVRLTRAGVAMAVRGLLYSTDLAALLPLTLEQAAAGDWQPLVAQTLLLSDGAAQSMSVGLMLATVCAEDVPRLQTLDLARQVSGTFLGSAAIDEVRRMCNLWPLAPGESIAAARQRLVSTAALAAARRDARPVTSDVPTLLLSGEADPVTPPRWAEAARAGLRNARHVVLRGLGHGVSGRACAPRMVARFLDAADDPAAALAAVRCDIQSSRPAFFLSPSGPAP